MVALPAALALACTLVACGTENAGAEQSGDGGADAPTSASDGADAGAPCTPAGDALPEVSGDFGTVPTFSWPDGCAPEGLQVEVLADGDGREVSSGAAVVANYAGYVWGSDTAFDSSYERGAPAMFSLNQVVAGWTEGIPGNLVGSRLLISIPPDKGYGETGNAGAGIAGTDTIVFVVDLVESYNSDDAGHADAPAANEPPAGISVTGAPGEPATIAVAAGTPEPTDVAVTSITTGTGEPVAVGQNVALAYSLVPWDGSSVESTWTGETAPLGPTVSQLGTGSVLDALAGNATVGSRVVMVIPGDESGPAVAVVLDVLGAA
ncbi:MAG: FKBP-type peptidyl-prolyl cis-trans isomerase [Beutenbergiaceae bacterium]